MSTMNRPSMTVRQLAQFLKPLEDDFKCPICFEILQEPHLTTCCGNHHLCKDCMENVKEANGGCPFCQQKPFNGFIDKRFERQLYELQVYCIYRPKGCDWVGNFGKVEQHLNIDEENGECQFVTVRCPVSVKCEESILRKYLKNHINNICIYRRAQCMYCEFVSTYEKITTLHITKCTKYPLLCPNECSDQTYPRDQLDTHLALCPEQEVDCTFSEMGCKEKIKRQVLQEHLETNILQHQVIMCQAFKEIKKDKQKVEKQLELLKRDKKELENKIQDMQKDNQIKSLKFIAIEKNRSLYCSKMAELFDINPVAPLVLKASFQINRQGQYNAGNHYTAQPYKSPFFYSFLNGYKLQLSAEVVCQCSNCVKAVQPRSIQLQYQDESYYPPQHQLLNAPYGFHSVLVETKLSLSVNLYILKGEHDSQLKWPFKEKVTITTIQENNKYISVEKIFEGNQNHTNNGIKLGINPANTPLPLIPLDPAQFKEVENVKLDYNYEHQQIFEDVKLNYQYQPRCEDVELDYQYQPRFEDVSVELDDEYHPIFEEISIPLAIDHSCSQLAQSSRNVQNDIVFFEVTFSPQLLH